MEFKRTPTRPHRPRPSVSQPAPVSPRPIPEKNDAPRRTPHKISFEDIKQLFFSKRFLIALAVLIVISLLLFGSLSRQQNTNKNAAQADPSKQTEPPKNETVLPTGKNVEQLGGWKRVSPPESDPVFAYADTIDGVPISVSQQSLPDSFKSNTDSHVAELAKKFNATNKIDAGGTTVFIGDSSKGPQSVILTKKGALIMIKSQKKITDKSWITYIKTLG